MRIIKILMISFLVFSIVFLLAGLLFIYLEIKPGYNLVVWSVVCAIISQGLNLALIYKMAKRIENEKR